MKKVQISFPDKQRLLLNKEAANYGISLAEIVRRIVDKYFDDKVKKEE